MHSALKINTNQRSNNLPKRTTIYRKESKKTEKNERYRKEPKI